METYVFRHGKCNYIQGKVPLERANDLSPEGIVRVTSNAQHLGDRLIRGLPVKITSSPYGRTLHSARLISDVLREMEYDVKDIVPNEGLEEIHDFDRALFLALVNGGDINDNGSRFTIDPSITNPNNLGATDYFRKDINHRLPSSVREYLLPNILDRVLRFESVESAQQRLEKVLSTVTSPNHILVTHEGLTGNYSVQATNNPLAILEPGEYLVLNRTGGDWHATEKH